MAEVSFLHFLEEEHGDGAAEDIVNLDYFPYWSHICSSDSGSLSPRRRNRCSAIDDRISAPDSAVRISDAVGSSVGDRKNQVNFVMDLFHQRVEQSHVMGSDQFVSEPVNESSFGVIEENDEMGINLLDLELGLGLEAGIEIDGNSDGGDDDDDGYSCGGFVMSDCGDEFFVSRRDTGNCNLGSSSRIGGLSVVGIGSDSEEEEGNELLEIDVQSEEEDYTVDNVNDDGIGNAFCWDSLQLEDHGESNNDFEWEEVDGRIDEREVLSIVADPDEEESISVLPISGPNDEGPGGGDRGRGSGNLEWEVLLTVNNLERNAEAEDSGPYFVDNDFYTAEYEMMFGLFADGENVFLGHPPASKSFVDMLPSVVMTEEDVLNEKALCAICKDQIGVAEEGKQLPCSHRYHGDCILPWLEIRNTCPVCRYELPTDDPDYEQRRMRRAVRAL